MLRELSDRLAIQADPIFMDFEKLQLTPRQVGRDNILFTLWLLVHVESMFAFNAHCLTFRFTTKHKFTHYCNQLHSTLTFIRLEVPFSWTSDISLIVSILHDVSFEKKDVELTAIIARVLRQSLIFGSTWMGA